MRRIAIVGAPLSLVLPATLAGGITARIPPLSTVVALVAGGSSAYLEAARGMQDALRGAAPDATLSSIRLDADGATEGARAALGARPDLVVAIGSRAVRLARDVGVQAPIVYAMVLDPASLGLPAPGQPPADNVTGVALDVTLARQFALMRELVPGARRVGVLYDPSLSGDAVRRAAVEAEAFGLTLVAQAVRQERDVMDAASLLLPRADMLWALPDATVLRPTTARGLILLWLRAGKPIFATSEAFVRNGALAALAADPTAVGRRAGELAGRILAGTPAAALRPEEPPRVGLYLNLATAGHLAIDLPQDAIGRAVAVYPRP